MSGHYKTFWFILFISLIWGPSNTRNFEINNPVELGRVKWHRDLQLSQKLSKTSGKPILILFQEVPGCSTCKKYGSEVLSHPLIVEAIEDLFIPLVIYNNLAGADRKVLDFFKEPSWNNPVIRIIDQNLNPLVDRLAGSYTPLSIIQKMNAAILKLGHRIPMYLELLETENLAYYNGVEKTYIGMYCFWSGEKNFASLDGIVGTKAGFMNGSEVVEISYNPQKVSLEQIIRYGKQNKNADILFSDINKNNNFKMAIPIRNPGSFKLDPENKYYIYKSEYKYLPMTRIQALKINSGLANGQNVEQFLSPRQLETLKKIRNKTSDYSKNCIDQDITETWYSIK